MLVSYTLIDTSLTDDAALASAGLGFMFCRKACRGILRAMDIKLHVVFVPTVLVN